MMDSGEVRQPSVEEGAKVPQAVALELVPLDGGKDLVLRQVVVHSAARRLLAPAQLAAELPLPGRGDRRRSALRSLRLLTVWLDGGSAALAALDSHCWERTC